MRVVAEAMWRAVRGEDMDVCMRRENCEEKRGFNVVSIVACLTVRQVSIFLRD